MRFLGSILMLVIQRCVALRCKTWLDSTKFHKHDLFWGNKMKFCILLVCPGLFFFLMMHYLFCICKFFTEHPWLQNAKKAPNVPLGDVVKSRLKQFSMMNRFKRKALRVGGALLYMPFIGNNILLYWILFNNLS